MEKFTAQPEDWEVEDPNTQDAVSQWPYYKSMMIAAVICALLAAAYGVPAQSDTSFDPTPLFNSKIDRTYVDRTTNAGRD